VGGGKTLGPARDKGLVPGVGAWAVVLKPESPRVEVAAEPELSRILR
jgi:hypothetical protein